MRGLEATELDVTAILVKCGDLWEIRSWNRVTGDGAIGPRLSRGDNLPDIPTKTDSREEGELHRQAWQEYLDERPKRKWKNRR